MYEIGAPLDNPGPWPYSSRMRNTIMPLLAALLLPAAAFAAEKSPSPGETVLAWNHALAAGDVAKAEALTSKTAADWIAKKAGGSLKALSEKYRKGPKAEETLVREEESGDNAVAVYRVAYPNGKVSYYMDALRKEDGRWKVAPQHVASIVLKAAP